MMNIDQLTTQIFYSIPEDVSHGMVLEALTFILAAAIIQMAEGDIQTEVMLTEVVSSDLSLKVHAQGIGETFH
jgi:hypothetical protein